MGLLGALKGLVGRIPVLGPFTRRSYRRLRQRFPGSAQYWEERYRQGGDSGSGSYAEFATFKAEFLNGFVERHGVASVLEFGCGDGHQLTLARYPRYLGFDVAPTAVEQCRARFTGDDTKQFRLVSEYRGETAELVLSLDVIYHLVEDAAFDAYMRRLVEATTKHLVVYASDTDDTLGNDAPHVRHRRFSDWIRRHAPQLVRVEVVPNRHPWDAATRTGSFADFHVFRRA